ncbi:MAG: homoserine dehydrogenase [Hyphomicrobium sp.]|jgi:homoserine dehydrogenase|nr:homoserine dehydrogenase [Hyphomicrobium sp.]
MKEPLKLGIAGLGTVGAGLLQLIAKHGAGLGETLERRIEVVAVCARNRDKVRAVDTGNAVWFDDPVALARDPSIDCFVELIGGDEGPARAAVEAALKARKHVVTANKALLAKHGMQLAKLAEANGVALNFEAAVAGGIPVIKTLREALAANEVKRVYGILNGTCNYILSKMQDEHLAFDDVLNDAQAKGYAESDPTFDIGGFDAAHKLALLTSLAFGTELSSDQIHVEGIQSINAADIEAAANLGYRVKLLGVAERTPTGIEARVHPAFVPEDATIAQVSGVTNCVAIEGDFSGSVLLVGPGAGSKPTASAVASDIIDVARGFVLPPFLRPVAQLKPFKRADLSGHYGSYYVRLSVLDRPGAMASIAKRMGDRGVSLESIVQKKPGTADSAASVVLITHETTEENIRQALDAIEADGKVAARPQMIRIEEL